MSIQVIFFDLGETLVTSNRAWLPDAKPVLSQLKQKGFRLGLISNTGDLPDRTAILNLLPIDFDLGNFGSLVLFSSEVGIAKPKRQIFEKAVQAANIGASNCLYCSEDAVEVLVAQSTGMHSLRIVTGSDDLKKLTSFIEKFESNAQA